jgi:TolA-binding protein
MKKLSLGLSLALMALCASMTTSCVTTREEGEAMRADISALKTEAATLQKEASDERERTSIRLDAVATRITNLEATLSSLRQADADTGVQMERVIAELQTLRGEVEEARHQLGETSATVQSILARPPVEVAAAAQAPKVNAADTAVKIDDQPVPADAQGHYDFAKKLFDAKKFTEAADAFDLFLTKHPEKPSLMDNASFWKAESYYGLAGTLTDGKAKEKAYKQAILAYQRVLESPKSEKADGALFKIGLSFEQLGYKDEAKVFYEELIAKHGDSPLLEDAKKRLKTLKAAPKAPVKKSK